MLSTAAIHVFIISTLATKALHRLSPLPMFPPAQGRPRQARSSILHRTPLAASVAPPRRHVLNCDTTEQAGRALARVKVFWPLRKPLVWWCTATGVEETSRMSSRAGRTGRRGGTGRDPWRICQGGPLLDSYLQLLPVQRQGLLLSQGIHFWARNTSGAARHHRAGLGGADVEQAQQRQQDQSDSSRQKRSRGRKDDSSGGFHPSRLAVGKPHKHGMEAIPPDISFGSESWISAPIIVSFGSVSR